MIKYQIFTLNNLKNNKLIKINFFQSLDLIEKIGKLALVCNDPILSMN